MVAEAVRKNIGERVEADLAVVIVRHDEPAGMLSFCLNKMIAQEGAALEVHILDQKNERGIEDMVSGLDGRNGHSFTYHAVDNDSLSFSRNLGVTLSGCRYVAFTDPDCRPSRDWAAALRHALERPGVAAAGGRVRLAWMGRANWLHRTLFVKERFAFFDLGEQAKQTDRLVGGSFSLDKEALSLPDLFSESLGRDMGRLHGGEETDLCQRIISQGGVVFYTPEGYVDHLIPLERMTTRELFKRAYYSGSSRAKRGGVPKPLHANKAAADYLAVAVFAPFYLAGYLYARFRLLQKPLNS